MIYIAILGMTSMGIIFFMLSRTDPVAYMYGFDILSFMIFFSIIIITLVRLRRSGSWLYFDRPKHNKPLLEFLYRDGSKRPILGERIPGTGFFSVKQLGIVQDIGRLPAPGSVYFHGDKPIRFVLQDINHTPNPKFPGYYSFLTYLGFNRMDEVQEVLDGYNPELMVKVWDRLVDYTPKTSGDIMVDNIRIMDKKDIKNSNIAWKQELRDNRKINIDRVVDEILHEHKN